MSKKPKGIMTPSVSSDSNHLPTVEPSFDQLFLRVLRIDVIASNIILPLLDWNDVSALFLSSRSVEEIFRDNGYWRTLIKRSQADEGRLKFVTTLAGIDPDEIRNSVDARVFHDVGRTLATNMEKWKELFAHDSLPPGNLYTLKNDSLVLRNIGGDEKVQRRGLWSFIVDESCRYVIGHRLIRSMPRRTLDASPYEEDEHAGRPQIFVWKVEEDDSIVAHNSFSMNAEWATTLLRHAAPLFYFSIGDHVMSIYETVELHVRFMAIWDWRRGIQVTAYQDVNGGEFEEFFRFSKLCAKKGFIATGNGLSVKVWRTDDGWYSVTKKFPEIWTHCQDLDFDEDFLVTVGICTKGVGFLVDENKLVLRVWSMKDGTKLRQVRSCNFDFILFDRKLLFPRFGKDEDVARWRCVHLSAGDQKIEVSSKSAPLRQIVLPEFDRYVSKQLRQVAAPFKVNPNCVVGKFLTSFTPGTYAASGYGATSMPGIEIWDVATLLANGETAELVCGNGTDGSLIHRPCSVNSKRSELFTLNVRNKVKDELSIHDISFDSRRIILCFGDAIEIIPLLKN